MCTDENDIEELTGVYGPLCWQGYDKDLGGFKKLMKVWDYERIQLFHTVRVRNSKRTCLHVQTFEPSKERGDIATGLHHRTDEKK